MEIPEYAKIEKKSAIFDEPIDYPCWFDIQIEQLSATIHCSYYNIESRASYDDLVNDAFTMASKHNVKANYREDIPVVNAYGSTGILFKIEGPVASPYQFYLTDSTSHFLRGSLYFNRKVDYDSVTTIVQFIEKDIEHLMASVRWE